MITYGRLFVEGFWVEPGNPELLDITSPHDRSVVGRAVQARPADVERAVAVVRTSYEAGEWCLTPSAERIAVLCRFNALRGENAEEIAHLISLENGSAGWFTRAGQPGLTRQANAYLKAAEEFGWEETLVSSDLASLVGGVVGCEAVGVVAAVIVWKSPFSSVTSKVVSALVAGDCVVLGVSGEGSLSVGLLAGLLERVGLRGGVTPSAKGGAITVPCRARAEAPPLPGAPVRARVAVRLECRRRHPLGEPVVEFVGCRLLRAVAGERGVEPRLPYGVCCSRGAERVGVVGQPFVGDWVVLRCVSDVAGLEAFDAVAPGAVASVT